MAVYGFAPVIISAYICTFHLDAFIKAGICTSVCAVALYCANHVITVLFGPPVNHPYQVDFSNWEQYADGNLNLLILLSFLLICVVFIGIGVLRIHKKPTCE